MGVARAVPVRILSHGSGFNDSTSPHRLLRPYFASTMVKRRQVYCPHPSCREKDKTVRADGLAKHYQRVHREVHWAAIPKPATCRTADAPKPGQLNIAEALARATRLSPAANIRTEAPSAGLTDQTGAQTSRRSQEPSPSRLGGGTGGAGAGLAERAHAKTSRSQEPSASRQGAALGGASGVVVRIEQSSRDLVNQLLCSDNEPLSSDTVAVLQHLGRLIANQLGDTLVTREDLAKALERLVGESNGEKGNNNRWDNVPKGKFQTEGELFDAFGFEKAMNSNGEFIAFCPTCTKYLGRQYPPVGLKLHGKPLHRIADNWRDHLRTKTHLKAIDASGEIEREDAKLRKIGENLTRLVMQTIREAGSYQSFEKKVVDFYKMGGRVGRFNHSTKFVSGMVEAMYEVTMQRFRYWLHEIDPITGKPRVFAAAADKVTEQGRTGQVVGILAFDEGEIKAAFIDYTLARDGSGKGLASDVLELTLKQALGFASANDLVQHFVGFAADGQYIQNNFGREMAEWILRERGLSIDQESIDLLVQWILCTWDGAHRLELGINDVRKDKDGVGEQLNEVEWYKHVSGVISDIYSRYNYGQGYEELLDIANEEDVKLYALKKFCDTRFAQAEHKVYSNFLKNYKVLRKAVYKRTKMEPGNNQEKKAELKKAKSFMKCVFNCYWFMGRLIYLVPFLEKCMQLSLEMQTVNTLPWELIAAQDKFDSDLSAMIKCLRDEKGFDEHLFPALHKSVRGLNSTEQAATYVDVLRTGKLYKHQLKLDNDSTYIHDQEQAYKDTQHDAADWLHALQNFFKVRFLDDQHDMVHIMAKCLDLRFFAVHEFDGGLTLRQFLNQRVQNHYKRLWDWMDGSCTVKCYEWGECWDALCLVAERIHAEVTSFYRDATKPNPHHKWHDENRAVCVSGTEIQKWVMNK